METLNETLEKRLPYLMLSVEEFSQNYRDTKYELVSRVNFFLNEKGFQFG